MAGVNRTNTGLLWENRINNIAETLNLRSKSRSMVKQEKWAGSHNAWAVHTAGSPAIWYMEDAGQLPTPNKQDYERAKSYVKFLGGSIQYSDGAAASTSGENSIKDVVDSEMKGLIDDMLKLENGFFFRDGSGQVATVQTGTATTSLIVDDARMIWDKAVYEIYDPVGPALRGTVTVLRTSNQLSGQNATVTLAANVPAGTTAGDLVVWSNSLNRAITGLDALVDDSATTFQNINVSNFPRYSSLVLDGGNAAQDLTPTLFRQMFAGLMMKSGKDKAGELLTLTEPYQMINLEELYEGEYRTGPSDTIAGQSVATFQSALGKVTLVADTDCPYGKIFFVDRNDVSRTVMKDLYWRRNDKGAIFTVDQNSINYRASCLELSDMRIHARISSGKITNLNEELVTPY